MNLEEGHSTKGREGRGGERHQQQKQNKIQHHTYSIISAQKPKTQKLQLSQRSGKERRMGNVKPKVGGGDSNTGRRSGKMVEASSEAGGIGD